MNIELIERVCRDDNISDGAKLTFVLYQTIYSRTRKIPTTSQMLQARDITRVTLSRHRGELKSKGYMSLGVKRNRPEDNLGVNKFDTNQGGSHRVYRTDLDQHNNNNRGPPQIVSILIHEEKASKRVTLRKPIRRKDAIECCRLSAEHLKRSEFQTLALLGLWFLKYEEHMGIGYVCVRNEKLIDMHTRMSLLLQDHPPEIIIEAMELFFTHDYVSRRDWIYMLYNSFTSTALFARHLRPLVVRSSKQRKGSLGDRPRSKTKVNLGVDKQSKRLFRRPIE